MTCSHQTNVLVMDDENYAAFKNDEPYDWIGGFSSVFPVRITVSTPGYWNIVFSLPDTLSSSEFDYVINKR
ncbi:DUF1883 domain-containing protein [Xenorhabdus bovienii]|uniref:DUF1883 domain-containing protein n=1 Tax=Xenorhabdus bovienii TaxID=40576 RepID=A0AAJ1J871_XENBV|nr:DUF1883 domain-containing protein [Xenorhabdus bovienii]MDE1492476.1 DUF1883 domain-containing protein [Xenorhabdus bovienii]